MSMIQIQEAIIVEGKYDVNTIRQIIDTVVIETGGFKIFSDRERLQMIRKIAEKRGILILTDSDGAGFVIRNFIKGAVPPSQVKHAYIPDILGKESRKRQASKEGKLGVEGMSPEIIRTALLRAGVTLVDSLEVLDDQKPFQKMLNKTDFFELGLSGAGSTARRKALLKHLALPEHMSANALLEFINAVSSADEVRRFLSE